jgi:hypothetical protein
MRTNQRLDMDYCVGQQLAARGLRVDAGETAAYARQLEFLQAEAIEAKHPEFKGLSLVPVFGGAIPLGARSHTYRQIEGFGEAELLEAMAPEDFPTADVRGEEVSGLFRSVGAKYSVNIEELQAAAMMSTNVESEKAKIARKVMESKLDKLVWLGGGPFEGLTDDDMSEDDTTAAGTPDWEQAATADELTAIENTFRATINAQFVATKGLFPALDFVLSTKAWLKMGLWIPGTTAGGGKTIGDFLLSSVPGVRSISHCSRLDGVGAGGKDRLIAFPRDPEVMDVILPLRFEQFAPQLAGMQFTTYCRAKYGGIRQKHPLAVRRVDLTVT